MPETRRGRHRATAPVPPSRRTALPSAGRFVRAVLGTPVKRMGAVAAAASVALGAFTASALTPGTALAESHLTTTATQPRPTGPAPEVTADAEAAWDFETPDFTVKPKPKPKPTLVRQQVSRSASRAPANVPASLAAYGNGNIPLSELASIGGGHYLWGPAAEAFNALMAAAAADGVQIGITDSYRTYAEQVSVANRKGIYGRGGLAAVPGTSNHGWGLSVDLGLQGAAQSWMRANAGTYGFVEDVAGEPWHWTYHGS